MHCWVIDSRTCSEAFKQFFCVRKCHARVYVFIANVFARIRTSMLEETPELEFMTVLSIACVTKYTGMLSHPDTALSIPFLVREDPSIEIATPALRLGFSCTRELVKKCLVYAGPINPMLTKDKTICASRYFLQAMDDSIWCLNLNMHVCNNNKYTNLFL